MFGCFCQEWVGFDGGVVRWITFIGLWSGISSFTCGETLAVEMKNEMSFGMR